LPLTQDPHGGPLESLRRIEALGIADFHPVFAGPRLRGRGRGDKTRFDRRGQPGQDISQARHDGEAHLVGGVEKRGGGELRVHHRVAGARGPRWFTARWSNRLPALYSRSPGAQGSTSNGKGIRTPTTLIIIR
jgi:hypothetical protein